MVELKVRRVFVRRLLAKIVRYQSQRHRQVNMFTCRNTLDA